MGNITDGLVYVITDRDGSTCIKRLKSRLHQHGFIVCMSDNPDKHSYSNFNIEESEIHTIRKAEWYMSAKMPNIHETYYHEQQRLVDDVDEIKANVSLLMKNIGKIN